MTEDLERKTEWSKRKGFYGRKYSETNRGMGILRPLETCISFSNNTHSANETTINMHAALTS